MKTNFKTYERRKEDHNTQKYDENNKEDHNTQKYDENNK